MYAVKGENKLPKNEKIQFDYVFFYYLYVNIVAAYVCVVVRSENICVEAHSNDF